ncbi:disease resistance protein RGA2-like [Typha angustifolia]|uniref:disease resistance protein RGA2-like n=1 Tax=Typha angustifolia TaxID=59011 RepID=UPI003C2F2A8D
MLRDLETTILPQFQLMIEAVEKSCEHRRELELWLKKLKDALYEAADMVDLYDRQLHKEKPMKKLVRKLNIGMSHLALQKSNKIRTSLNKFEKIAFEGNTFHELSSRRPNVTTSIPPQRVFGRDDECEEIINKYLLSKRGFSVVAIVGIAGAGKTTVAQLVYNDERVAEHFDVRIWVCVSREIDVFKYTREMIESASKEECPLLENLDALQGVLMKMIRSKKVLVVFDDVSCDESMNEAEWEQLVAPLAVGDNESKMLVTTRTEKMPMALHPKNIMRLKDLREDEFISLFMHHALGETKLNDSYQQEELEKIGKQIVQKLGKSPFMAKAVGGQLSKRREVGAWRAALEREDLNDTAQALLRSYQRLDTALLLLFQSIS